MSTTELVASALLKNQVSTSDPKTFDVRIKESKYTASAHPAIRTVKEDSIKVFYKAKFIRTYMDSCAVDYSRKYFFIGKWFRIK